jgi:novobiocin biosynthesis protein NovU/D-mycarose 3-C-methyltransferase
VLAWNFIDEFIVKEADYLKAGGEFIVPVPKVEVIGADRVR